MHKFSLVVVALVALVMLSSAIAEPGDGATRAKPIPLSELQQRGVVGRLGLPLGTICHLEAKVTANVSKAKVHSAEDYFLQFTTVDGRPLEPGVLFAQSEVTLPRDATPLKIGDTARWVAYETGGYHGSPSGEFDYVQPYATQRFRFSTTVSVVKVE